MSDTTSSRRRVRTALVALTIHVLIGASSEAAVLANFTFSPTSPMAGQQVQFTDTSTGSPTNWQWDFENPPTGTDSTLQNPTWTFEDPGTYPVQLLALVPPFDIDSVIINVVVGPASDPGGLSFSTSSYEVTEDVGAAPITVRRTGGSDGAVSVQCNTADGTAQAGNDYTATTDTVSWVHGDTANKNCTIPITNDTTEEGNETINLLLTNFTGGADPVSPNTATLTILANDQAADLSFSTSSYQVYEDVGTASIAVHRTGGSDGVVSVRCRTVSGTATAGSDYTAINTTLSWTNGDTADKTCTLPIVDDALTESNETVNLSLTSPTGGATLGTPSTATLTILDNDASAPGELSFSMSSYQVTEDVGTASIAVRRTGSSDGAVSVRCNTANGTAEAGSDYVATMDTLNWVDGDTANKNCTIPIIDDTDVEGPETINLSLTNFTGGAALGSPSFAELTISDNDDCVADERTLCLNGGRYRIQIGWRDFEDQIGDGRTVPFGSDDSGLFWFFSPDNWEILVKVLDGCGVNDRVWVFAAATTNVEYTLEVTDTVTGEVGGYHNPLGNRADAITDTSAFASCPLDQRALKKTGIGTLLRDLRNPDFQVTITPAGSRARPNG